MILAGKILVNSFVIGIFFLNCLNKYKYIKIYINIKYILVLIYTALQVYVYYL